MEPVEHLFFLDYKSYPIALGRSQRYTTGYRVLETRVIEELGEQGFYYSFRHLVEWVED